MEVNVVSVTQQHIDTAIGNNCWNGTPTLLALREQGLGGSVGFRPSPSGGIPEILHTNEKHPTLEYEPPTYGGYWIRRGLYNWMTTFYKCFSKREYDRIKPVDIRLVKDGDNWYADTEEQ